MAEPNLRELREILQRVEAGEATPADHTAVIEFIQPILDSVQTERANVNPNANLRQQTNERLGIQNTVTRDTAARPYTDWVRNNPEAVDVMREVFKQYKPMDTYAGHAELSARQMAFSLPDLRHTLLTKLQQDTALNAPFTTRATPSESAAEDAALRTFGTKYGQEPNPEIGPVRMIVPVFDEQGNPSGGHTHQTVLVHETTQPVDGFRHVERGSGRQFNVVVGEEAVEEYIRSYRARPDVEDNFEPEFFDGRVAATATQAIDPSLEVEDTSIRPAAPDDAREEAPEPEVAVNPATNSAAIGNQIADLIAQNKPFTLQNLQNIKDGVQAIDAAYSQQHGQGSYIPSPADKEAVYELQRTVQATGSLEEIRLSVQIGQTTIQNSVIMDGDKPLGWVQNPVVLQWNADDVVDAANAVNIRRASVGLDPLPPEPVTETEPETRITSEALPPLRTETTERAAPVSETRETQASAEAGILSRGAEINGARDYLRDLDPEQVRQMQASFGMPEEERDGKFGQDTMAAAQRYFAENNLDPNTTFAELVTQQETQTAASDQSWDSDVAEGYYRAAAEMGNGGTATTFASVRGEHYVEPVERDVNSDPDYRQDSTYQSFNV